MLILKVCCRFTRRAFVVATLLSDDTQNLAFCPAPWAAFNRGRIIYELSAPPMLLSETKFRNLGMLYLHSSLMLRTLPLKFVELPCLLPDS